jgi:Cu(I)/Ag(I) efflux system membrane fusion protein
MKKFLLGSMILFLAACGGSDKPAEVAQVPQEPLGKSANSDAFNASFAQLLNDYYQLKDNFIAENDTLIQRYAQSMIRSSDSLKLSELKGDSSIIITAKTYTDGISAELKGLTGEKNIEEQRKSFQLVGDQLYDLIRTVQYDRAIVYHQFCPMAFNDAGAHWLSNNPNIRNPYLPKKMLICGEVSDSLDFRKK